MCPKLSYKGTRNKGISQTRIDNLKLECVQRLFLQGRRGMGKKSVFSGVAFLEAVCAIQVVVL